MYSSSLPPLPKYGSFHRRTLRIKEKYAILLVFATFTLVCLGGIFFLPEQVNMGSVKRRLHEAGNDMFLPQIKIGSDGNPILLGKMIRHNPDDEEDVHAKEDRSKLQNKVREAWENNKIIERIGNQITLPHEKHVQVLNDIKKDKQLIKEMNKPLEPLTLSPLVSEHYGGKNVMGGEPQSDEAKQRRNAVKEMMKFAWDGYVKYAWGSNELRPSSKTGHSTGIFGSSSFGASIIDALSTLYIMGYHEEFRRGRHWVAKSFTFDQPGELSVFETNIRFVGGLLSAYALSGDPIFKEKAEMVAKRLLPAFDTPTGIPNAVVNLRTGASHNYGWAAGGASILAEFGTLHLEMSYLSAITGNPIYANKVNRIRQHIVSIDKPYGLYPNYLHPGTGNWGSHHVSMGALGDSFYEYLLKAWLQSGEEDKEARKMYDDAIEAMENKGMIRKSGSGLLFFAEYRNNHLENKMGHLACFSGGMLALGANDSRNKTKYLEYGAGIANTCHESYIRAANQLGPETFRFDGPREATAMRQNEKYYILRPETVETYFYMYRITKDQKYRDWAWEAVQAINKSCRASAGFAGIRDVYANPPQQDDVQQSWLLAETFKYLYLVFCDDDVLPFSDWVLNTEAHPLPIKGSSSWKIVNQNTNIESNNKLGKNSKKISQPADKFIVEPAKV